MISPSLKQGSYRCQRGNFLSLFAFILFATRLFSQQAPVDSTKTFLASAPLDTSKVLTLNDLSRKGWQTGEYILAREYANEALELAKKIDFGTGVASAYNNLGATYWGLGNYPEALKYYMEQLKTGTSINDEKTIARSYHGIGLIYDEQNKIQETLKNYKEALRIYLKTGNKKGVAAIYNNIGGVYSKQEDYQKALVNYIEAQKIRKAINDELGIAGTHNNIGTVYMQKGNLELKNGDKKEASASYHKALNNFYESLKMKEALGDKQGVSTSCVNIAEIKINLGEFDEGEKYLLKSLAVAKKIGNVEGIMGTYQSYVKLDSNKNNFTKALEHYKLYVVYNDSLKNEENIQKAFQAKIQYEFERKESDQIAAQERQNELMTKEKNNQRITLLLVLTVLLLMVIFIIVILRNFRQVQKISSEVIIQTIIIEEKQKEILDSIRYAKKIQLSLLPSEKYIHKQLQKFGKNQQ